MITIVCVLKYGGIYTKDYVKKLMHGVERNTTIPYKFVCLTDITIDFCETIPLTDNLKGWWSKIELFRPNLFDTDRVVYFDLDTVIVGNIDKYLQQDYDFIGLQDFYKVTFLNPYNIASGILSWRNNGKFDFLYNEFARTKKYYRGDQNYISDKFREKEIKANHWQFLVAGIVSYKVHCKQALPDKAKIVCFHGRPRPNEVKTGWMEEHWV